MPETKSLSCDRCDRTLLISKRLCGACQRLRLDAATAVILAGYSANPNMGGDSGIRVRFAIRDAKEMVRQLDEGDNVTS